MFCLERQAAVPLGGLLPKDEILINVLATSTKSEAPSETDPYTTATSDT